MMVYGIAVRFKRVAAAFEEVSKVRGCRSSSSSGSEHSPAAEGESLRDLSDLVNSFLEKGNFGNFESDENDGDELVVGEFDDHGRERLDSEGKDLVESLLGFEDGDDVRREIYLEVEEGLGVIGDSSSPEFKRRLVTWLRERGFDAGLCKSKWETIGRLPSGDYEYVDVSKNETRYIIEVSLAREFAIARSTNHYKSILENLPPIFVGKVEVLKQVVRLMCNGIKKSMKKMNMHVPPWRRQEYVQVKWFGSYKRTINEVSIKVEQDSVVNLIKERSVGFVLVLDKSFNYCRKDFVSKRDGFKVGNLAMAINGSNMV